MGDLIMSGPAIRALKESFDCKITVLTSSSAAAIAHNMPEIDDVIVFDLPWVKTINITEQPALYEVIEHVRARAFDAAVVFTVYSQNPLPTVLIAYLAGIPKRLAYCRENPYQLLTDWVPDKEPYSLIKHQVQRDIDLVASVNATTLNQDLNLIIHDNLWSSVQNKLNSAGVDVAKPWLILHAGVSEVKRQYPASGWIDIGKRLISEMGLQLILTGLNDEKVLTDELQENIGNGSFSMAGLFKLEEFITLISRSILVLSVNTGTVHIAAAAKTPIVVLYALSNPQHTPWRVPHKVLPFSIYKSLASKNEVIRFVNDRLYSETIDFPLVDEVLNAISELIRAGDKELLR